MRRIVVIGRSWETIDRWIREANHGYRHVEFTPLLADFHTDASKVAGLRNPQVVDLANLQPDEPLYQALVLRGAVWIES